MSEEQYRKLHTYLMEDLRRQLRSHKISQMEKAGLRLHRLRRRYRRHHAAGNH